MADEVADAGRQQIDYESREGSREGAPNPTQERIDREGAEERPVDAAWEEDRWGDHSGGEREPEVGPRA